jgi:hypothetical protein
VLELAGPSGDADAQAGSGVNLLPFGPQPPATCQVQSSCSWDPPTR